MKDKNYKELKEICLNRGADLFGVAGITGVKEEFSLVSTLTKELDKAICIGVRLSQQIFNDIENAPTKLYFHHYKTANMFLDQVNFELTNHIQRKGALALPIAASQIVDWQKQTAHVSHKKIGVLAGLGWIGRNNLLVNPELGSQFRLATVLTNLDIKVDKPLNRDCNDCYNCVKVCPVNAIKEKREDFNHVICFEKLKEFQRSNIVSQYICGICVKACQMKPKLTERKRT
ncbi:MAG: 4Fe-4S binding protein [Candidatus Omnitrophota bacterium]